MTDRFFSTEPPRKPIRPSRINTKKKKKKTLSIIGGWNAEINKNKK